MPDYLGRLSSDWRPFFCDEARSKCSGMFYLAIKAAVSGVLVAAISEIARRFPGWGGLVASLPLTSLLAMTWLYRDTGNREQVASLATSTFWFVLASLPLFLILPALLRSGMAFWYALATAVAGSLLVYALLYWSASKVGIDL